ncbi:MAG: class I SAM-dependent methyltransferase [Treponema sp.]|nr:class I SAM-dependent methyltransferase [Treponema sp.]
MYEKLAQYLKRPALYERSSESLWDDPYISKQLLAAHLDPDTDAASRKPDFINQSADWIASFLRPGDSLLDIGCGPGLYTKLFAQRGLRVVGMDFSKNSLEYARRNDAKSEYLLQNYLLMNFKNVFDMITLIYCDYGALVPKERCNLLNRIYKALKPGGHFLLDVCTPFFGEEMEDSATWEVKPKGGFWSPKPHVYLDAEYFYDASAQVARYVIIEKNKARQFNVWNCYFTEETLLEEASIFGFSPLGFFDDVKGQARSADSKTLCAIFKKKAE